jgi:hypothetical protein
VLTGEGVDVMEKGSHEARMFQAVDKDSGSLQTELMVSSNYNNCMNLHTYMWILLKTLYSRVLVTLNFADHHCQ